MDGDGEGDNFGDGEGEGDRAGDGLGDGDGEGDNFGDGEGEGDGEIEGEGDGLSPQGTVKVVEQAFSCSTTKTGAGAADIVGLGDGFSVVGVVGFLIMYTTATAAAISRKMTTDISSVFFSDVVIGLLLSKLDHI